MILDSRCPRRKFSKNKRGLVYVLAATASLKAFPALNAGTAFSGISISAPVEGFLPFLAERTFLSKLPKPTIVTFWSVKMEGKYNQHPFK
jgi:hypothetical protein